MLKLSIGSAISNVIKTIATTTKKVVNYTLATIQAILTPNADVRTFIVDKYGRIVLYHGICISNYSKTSTNHVPWQAVPTDYSKLFHWGFNLVRLLVFWEEIEPIRGQYNTAYINRLRPFLAYMKLVGIDVVLDFHQDLFNRKFGGNGFPDWAVNDNGIHFSPVTPWNLNYLQPAVIASYYNFYNSASLRTDYVNMMSWTLNQLKEYPNIIGVDMINEPFPAQLGNFEKVTLTNFYKQIHTMIKQKGYAVRVFFEPEMYTSAGIPSALAFNPGVNQGVYSPHYYDAIVHEGGNYTAAQREAMKIAVDLKIGEGKKLGSPVVFTEWGCGASLNYLNYMQDFLDLMDKYIIGWCYWSYDKMSYSSFGILNDDGTPRQHLSKLVRPYPQRILGKNLKFENGPNYIKVNYDATFGVKAPTVIFIPLTLPTPTIKINGVTQPQNPRPEHLTWYNTDNKPQQEIIVSW